jgi:hypothetical protein
MSVISRHTIKEISMANSNNDKPPHFAPLVELIISALGTQESLCSYTNLDNDIIPINHSIVDNTSATRTPRSAHQLLLKTINDGKDVGKLTLHTQDRNLQKVFAALSPPSAHSGTYTFDLNNTSTRNSLLTLLFERKADQVTADTAESVRQVMMSSGEELKVLEDQLRKMNMETQALSLKARENLKTVAGKAVAGKAITL